MRWCRWHAGRTGIRAIAFGGAGVCHKSRGTEGLVRPAKRSSTPNYSIDTVRRLKQSLKKSDRIFFLIGIDAFREIAQWRDARALLAECDFIVASRPGFSLRDVAESLPQELRPPSAVTRPFQKQPAKGDLVLPGVTLHLLEGVQQKASATIIRAAAAQASRWQSGSTRAWPITSRNKDCTGEEPRRNIRFPHPSGVSLASGVQSIISYEEEE